MPQPPTPGAPAAHTAPATRLTYDYVTRTIAGTLGNPGRGYYALLGSAVTLLAIGIVCLLYLLRYGLGLAGYSMPTYWTVFAVMTAGLFPLIHIGRQWYFYWLIPYPNERGLWPNFKSPLIWDEFAI